MRKIEDIVIEEMVSRRNKLLQNEEILSSIARGNFRNTKKISFFHLTLGLNLKQCKGIIEDLEENQNISFLETYYKHTNTL
jgi:hypothetical protein|tara:strand:- start:414 stop:656 length:243 start_codon:yes stop_codon:yes gene_type:complete